MSFRSARSFLIGAGLMAGTEMVNRVARIATAIVLARTLDIAEFGVAAVVLTTWELVRMLTHNGLGARIVAARPEELGTVCRAVAGLNWGVHLTIFTVQCAIAPAMARAFERPDIAPMLWALAGTYLVYPFVMTRAFLAQRDPRLVFTAATGAGALAFDSLATAGFALAGYGAWSVVLPKLIVAPAWLAIHLAWAPKPPKAEGDTGPARRAIAGFSARVLAAESLNTLRQHADRLVVGRVLGLEALGLYAFAINSGVGNTQSLATALGNAILPFLSRPNAASDLRGRFWTSVVTMACGIVPIVALQASLASWYVPLVFGQRWVSAAPLLSVLCLMALARVFTVPVTQLLRSAGLAKLEVRQSLISAALFVVALCAGLPFGLMGLAIALVIAALVPVPFFVFSALAAAAPRPASPTLEGAPA